MNYWIRKTGVNTLKGIEGDPDNPPILPAYLIMEFLSDGNQKARDDFLALLPSMTELEQERLNEIYAFSRAPQKYDQVVEDDFQKSMNKLVIRNPNRNLINQQTNQSNPKSKLKVRL